MAWSGPTSGLGACSYTGRTTLEKGHSTAWAEQRSHRTKSYRKSDYCTSGSRGLVSSRAPELGAVEADVGREKAWETGGNASQITAGHVGLGAVCEMQNSWSD